MAYQDNKCCNSRFKFHPVPSGDAGIRGPTGPVGIQGPPGPPRQMSFGGLQIITTEVFGVPSFENVQFQKLVVSLDNDITFDENFPDKVTITREGLYLVKWWLLCQSITNTNSQMSIISNGQPISVTTLPTGANNTIVSSTIINVASNPTTINLRNTSIGDVLYPLDLRITTFVGLTILSITM